MLCHSSCATYIHYCFAVYSVTSVLMQCMHECTSIHTICGSITCTVCILQGFRPSTCRVWLGRIKGYVHADVSTSIKANEERLKRV